MRVERTYARKVKAALEISGASSRVSQARASFQSRMTLCGGDLENLPGLLYRQPSEKTQFDDLCPARIQPSKRVQGVVERAQLRAWIRTDGRQKVEIDGG